MAEETAFENGKISNFQELMTMTLTLDRVILHTVVHHYLPNFIEIKDTFCGQTDVRTDRHLRPLKRVDLIIYSKSRQLIHETL